MKKENRLRYILPENRTVRIVLAVFFWLLAAACAGCIFWLSSRDGNQSKDMSDNVRGILAKILGSPLGSFIVRKFAHFFEYAVLGFLIGCALPQPQAFFARYLRHLQCPLFSQRRDTPVFRPRTSMPHFRCRSRHPRRADGYTYPHAHNSYSKLNRNAQKGKIFRVNF